MKVYIPCDECYVARSWSHVLLPSGRELFWCGHHLTVHYDALIELGAYIAIDDRHLILEP